MIGNTVLYGATSGEAYLQRRRGRAFCGSQLRRDGGRRGRRRSRLRVHDQRHGGGAGQNRAQLRRRHERRSPTFSTLKRRFCAGTAAISAGVDLEPLFDAEDIARLKTSDPQACRLHRKPARQTSILDNWAQMLPHFVKVFPHEYKRVLRRPKRSRAQEAAAAALPTDRHSGRPRRSAIAPMAKDNRLSGVRARNPRAGQCSSASTTGSRFTRISRTQSCRRRPRAAWIAAFRSATPAARSTTSFRTGTTWSGKTAGAKRIRAAARHQQLPGVHGPHLPGSV